VEQVQPTQAAPDGGAGAPKGSDPQGGSLGHGRVEPVSPAALNALIPGFDGWQRTEPNAERLVIPFAFTIANVDYEKADAQINLKITDSVLDQDMLRPYTIARNEYATAETHQKVMKINSQPGWEQWDGSSKDGELHALVGSRILVDITGRGIESTKILHDLAGKIDMNKLAALK